MNSSGDFPTDGDYGSMDKRKFLVGAAGGVGAAATLAQQSAGEPVEAKPGAGKTILRATVLEFGDRWTERATGLIPLLESAGFRVATLNLDHPPSEQSPRPDLLAFGSFTNNDDAYRRYTERFTSGIQDYAASGGVVLEMTQSDQFGARVPYLPAGAEAVRGDRDLDRVCMFDPDHPLTAWFPSGSADVSSDHFHRDHPNWESFDRWKGMRVLLASEPGGSSPCLLEAAHGKGRFLASSLWIDKVLRDGQSAYGDAATQASQPFFDCLFDYVAMVTRGEAPNVIPTPVPPTPPVGPMIGHVDASSARIWFRPGDAGADSPWVCELLRAGQVVDSQSAVPDADHDFTLVFRFVDLSAATDYSYRITPSATPSSSVAIGPFALSTPAVDETPAVATLGFGSCAPSDPNRVWTRVVEEACEGFVFLGDTPYIDSNDLFIARQKHRRFLSQPEIASMIAQMPCWGTWDDHDFGKNDGHGDYPGKHTCRTAFTEYRANASYGHDEVGEVQSDRFGSGRGIYTSFRRGPIEVFLLDPRWFSRTEPSWADPDQPTCLGRVQWEWLKRGLETSTAPFKALATGMIWDDKKNSERDDWHTYRHEREAIFDFIRERRIAGCFLIGGDIHVSRALNYGPRVGYDLWQFIISPLHGSTIPSLDVPHPDLVHHAVEPFVFLKLEASSETAVATLNATWINRDGRRVFKVALNSNELKPNA